MENYNVEDFNYDANDLSESHGVTANCILTWAAKGAFPLLRKGGRIFFHKDSLCMIGGEIKSNIKDGKFKKPIFVLEKDKKPTRLKNLEIRIATIERILGL